MFGTEPRSRAGVDAYAQVPVATRRLQCCRDIPEEPVADTVGPKNALSSSDQFYGHRLRLMGVHQVAIAAVWCPSRYRVSTA